MKIVWPRKLQLLCCLVVLSGCASMQQSSNDHRDPIEGTNRAIYGFNNNVDEAVLNPLGQIYQTVVPDIVEEFISNFFSNIGEVSVIANDVLQLKIDQAFSDIMRFATNSTLGILGIFDVATSIGLEKHDEDFGQTLGHWGFGPGFYVVAPLLGPATIRDAVGFVVDSIMNPIGYLTNGVDLGLMSLNYVDRKADSTRVDQLVSSAALDEYEFVKNAYFEKRQYQITGYSDDSKEPFSSISPEEPLPSILPEEAWMKLLSINDIDVAVELSSEKHLASWH